MVFALVFGVCPSVCGPQISLAQISSFEIGSSEISFGRDVRPILNQHCIACHGGVKQAAGLSFVYEDQVVGEVVEAGDSEASELIERVVTEDEDDRMPPAEHGRRLNAKEIGILRAWIDRGATWEPHWAFAIPESPALPSTKNKSWPRQPIDRFVLARLERESIVPSDPAPPYRWLRRVTLDLTGLPPSLSERNEFLSRLDQCANSREIDQVYAATVDRLLDSPRFGERWASVWLDQVRYADSKGLGADGRRNIWKYRDWVINALNRDLPYDQFTIKQIAGDLLPDAGINDRIATAAHRLTQTNEEGGTDDEEFRVAAVLDRVNTTWQAWQGVTFGCVQCHAHPYDPIRHTEYYQFAAFFNNTADSDLNEDWPVLEAPVERAQYELASQLDSRIGKLNQSIWQTEYDLLASEEFWSPLDLNSATTNNQTQVVIEKANGVAEYHTVDTVSSNTDITLTGPVPESVNELTAIRLTLAPLEPATAATDSEWGFSLSHVVANLIGPDAAVTPLEIDRLIADEPDPFFDPQESLNPKSSRGFATYTRIYRPRSVALVLREPVDIAAGSELQVVLKHRLFILASFPLIARRGQVAITGTEAFAELQQNPQLQERRNLLAKLRRERSEIKSTPVPVLRERPDHLSRTQHLFIRGLFLTKDRAVPAGMPQAFGPRSKSNLEDAKLSRLDLARWLVSNENPLTARVAVNRLWARLFGIGLVATEEDFGSSGELPSHPALLDFLATRFQNELGWSQKKLLREIVLSSTYRQSSVVRDDLQEIDPSNRLLARGPRHRLPAEIVRDSALAISGLLSDNQFGPPVHPPIPAGVWRPFQGDKWSTPPPDSADRYRRSIYTYQKRSIPFPMFAAFDAPSREVCTPRRLRSNTPLQALMSLNDQTMIECAAALAKRMQMAADGSAARIAFGFELATCRRPNKLESSELIQLLDDYPESEKEAAWQAVAFVLLNLDEVVNK